MAVASDQCQHIARSSRRRRCRPVPNNTGSIYSASGHGRVSGLRKEQACFVARADTNSGLTPRFAQCVGHSAQAGVPVRRPPRLRSHPNVIQLHRPDQRRCLARPHQRVRTAAHRWFCGRRTMGQRRTSSFMDAQTIRAALAWSFCKRRRQPRSQVQQVQEVGAEQLGFEVE